MQQRQRQRQRRPQAGALNQNPSRSHSPRRRFLCELTALAALPLAWHAGFAQAAAQTFDFSAEQKGRVRAPKDPDASRAALAYRFITPGVFTVAVAPAAPPIATYATDAHSVVGADPDYAQLLADALGLRLQLVPVAWADWPLGLTSGRYDAVISNVGVTEARKKKFDFTTYRLGLHGFYVRNDSPIKAIREPRDIAGLRIVTGSGTIQEHILLEWNRRNVAQGLKAANRLIRDGQYRAALTRWGVQAQAVDHSETNPPGYPDV